MLVAPSLAMLATLAGCSDDAAEEDWVQEERPHQTRSAQYPLEAVQGRELHAPESFPGHLANATPRNLIRH